MVRKKNGKLRAVLIIILIVALISTAVFYITSMRTQAGYWDSNFWISIDKLFFPFLIGVFSIFATMFSNRIKKIIGLK